MNLRPICAALLAGTILSTPYYPLAEAQTRSGGGGVSSNGSGIVLPNWYINTLTAPHFADNAALAAANPANYPSDGVVRFKFDTIRPVRPMVFTPLTGTCTANSLVADGFHCVDGAGGNSWAGQIPTTEIINVDDYGAIHDGSSHPLSNYFPTSAAAAAVCPSLNNLVGYTTAATTTSGSASITITGTYKPYVVPGQHITGTNIPASTYIGTINYSTGAATLVQSDRTTAQNATATGADTITAGFDVTWSTVEMDWCAIDAAIWALRNSGGVASYYTRSVSLPAGSYKINQPINLTCLSTAAAAASNCLNAADHSKWLIALNGASISAGTISASSYSRVALDMMGSNQGIIRDGTIYGGPTCDGTQPLQRGIQLGRIGPAGGSAHYFVNMHVSGGYTQAPFYNLASEGTGTEASLFENCDTTNNAYKAIYDGGAHWQVTSMYTSVVMAQDVPQSFNDAFDIGSSFQLLGSGTGGGLWIYGSRRLTFDQTYVTAHNAPGITLYFGTAGGGDAATVAQMLDFSGHIEGSHANMVSVVSRSASGTPTIRGLRIRDHYAFATTNIFALGTNTTGVTLYNPQIEFTNSNSSPALFDTGSAWTVYDSSRIKLDGSTITGFAPTVGSCTGLGSGGSPGCAMGGGTNNVNRGSIVLTTGSGSTAATGAFVLTFPFPQGAKSICTWVSNPGSGTWTGVPTFKQTGGVTLSQQITWTDTAVLTASKTFIVEYWCTNR